MQHAILDSVLILLALSVVSVMLMRRLRLPPILAYLAIGVIVGPSGLAWIPETEVIQVMAEVGVVFLIFMIGLEFSFAQFFSMRRTIIGLGGAQVVISTLFGGLIAWKIGLTWQAALVAGGAMALSSTALVIKQLTEQIEMQSRHGRNALGVLLFQDLAAVPLLVVIPILAQGGSNLSGPLVLALAKAMLVFALIFLVGHFFLRRVLFAVASARSAELFTLTALLLALAAAWMTQWFGLSLALGAFLAGMMLGETEYRHQIETDIRPFRDILMGLFFISVAAQLNLKILPEIWHWILLLVTGVVVGKAALIGVMSKAFGDESGVAFRTGAVLGQGSEFGFAIIAVALQNNLLASSDSNPILASLIVSMFISPLVIRHNGMLAKWLFPKSYLRNRDLMANRISQQTKDLQNHVVICGFGRIGQHLAKFLRIEGIEYLALDLDPFLIKEAATAGEPVIYGDCTHPEILAASGLKRARAVVITSSSITVAEKTVAAARAVRESLPIIARVVDDLNLNRLEKAGASEVVPEALEASMMLATYLLERLDVPMDEVLRLVENARANHYQDLRCFFHGKETPEEDPGILRLHSVVLGDEAYAVGKRIIDLELRDRGVSVNALKRGAIRGDSPDVNLQLSKGDTLVLEGPKDQLEWAESYLLEGA